MTKQEFYSYLDELTSETGFDLDKVQKAFAYQAAKEYHHQTLYIHDAVNRSEQLDCSCGRSHESKELKNNKCALCNKQLIAN